MEKKIFLKQKSICKKWILIINLLMSNNVLHGKNDFAEVSKNLNRSKNNFVELSK